MNSSPVPAPRRKAGALDSVERETRTTNRVRREMRIGRETRRRRVWWDIIPTPTPPACNSNMRGEAGLRHCPHPRRGQNRLHRPRSRPRPPLLIVKGSDVVGRTCLYTRIRPNLHTRLQRSVRPFRVRLDAMARLR